VEIDLVVMNGNLYKVVIALMFGVCCLYAIDNPTPQHVMPKPMDWETYITLNMLEYEKAKIEGIMVMNMVATTNNNPATGND
jgi:hypothetical protein